MLGTEYFGYNLWFYPKDFDQHLMPQSLNFDEMCLIEI